MGDGPAVRSRAREGSVAEVEMAQGVGRTVTVLVPAYRPGVHVRVTLASLAAQTWPHVRVLLSLDHAPEHELPDLPPMGLVELEVVRQPRRLGWAAHVNDLLERVETPFFVIVSHDDALSADYLERTIQVLEARPEVVAAHGSVRVHGRREGGVMSMPDLVGERVDRVDAMLDLRPHRANLPWRAVTRRSLLLDGLRLRAAGDLAFFADMLWSLEVLLHGATASVPDVFYEKHLNPQGLVASWRGYPREAKAAAVADHLARTAEVLRWAGFPRAVEGRLLARWIDWALSVEGDWNVLSEDRTASGLTVAQARPAIAALMAQLAVGVADPRPVPAIPAVPVATPTIGGPHGAGARPASGSVRRTAAPGQNGSPGPSGPQAPGRGAGPVGWVRTIVRRATGG